MASKRRRATHSRTDIPLTWVHCSAPIRLASFMQAWAVPATDSAAGAESAGSPPAPTGRRPDTCGPLPLLLATMPTTAARTTAEATTWDQQAIRFVSAKFKHSSLRVLKVQLLVAPKT